MILIPVFTSLNPGLGSPVRLKNYYLASTGGLSFSIDDRVKMISADSYRHTRLILWLRLCLAWLPKKPMPDQ